MYKTLCGLGLITVLLLGCAPQQKNETHAGPFKTRAQLYSYIGSEYKVSFQAIYKTTGSISDLKDESTRNGIMYEITMTSRYLFGPLTERTIGGMQSNSMIIADWDNVTEEGDVMTIPYTYNGTWILANSAVKEGKLEELPLPYNYQNFRTTDWLKCTDSSPDHQSFDFLWYFWDPERYGCKHKVDVDFQMIDVVLGEQTVNQTETYPEYQKMIQSAGVANNFKMTFAFGYVEDKSDMNPETDSDYGVTQYRNFVKFMDIEAKTLNLTKTAILQKEYRHAYYPNKAIGYRYSGTKNGVAVEVKVVAAANIDQMVLFAQSYAHDHDAFFGWFGHSRVGSGFDAQNFASMLRYYPDYYKLSSQYQLVYWAGCNSYSYYSLPFFNQKADLDKTLDPQGTKNLDIIANALPSLFSFNADNAKIAYRALINWEKPTSYQTIVSDIEKNAQRSGYRVIVNVLGDEDNIK